MKGARLQTGRLIRLSLDGEALPNEFRILGAGWNETADGRRFLFDEKAAKLVMNAYEEHGAELMLDLEHLSLDQESASYDPDARAWLNLEVRAGELWAVNVRWTPDGETRLRNRTQRYTSPAFTTDKEGRVTDIFNVGLVAVPATNGLAPLIAASALSMSEEKEKMTPEQVAKLAEALGMDADANVEDVIAGLSALLQKVKDGLNPEAKEETPAEPTETSSETPPAEDDEEEEPTLKAASARLMKLTGHTTLSASLDEVNAWRKSHVEKVSAEEKLAKERQVLESSERQRLGARMVAGGMSPAQVWADDAAKKLSRPFAEMKIEELRAFASRGKSGRDRAPTPPPDVNVASLTARDIKVARDLKMTPEAYAAKKFGTTGDQ